MSFRALYITCFISSNHRLSGNSQFRGQSLPTENIWHSNCSYLSTAESVRLEPNLISFAEFVKMMDDRIAREVRSRRKIWKSPWTWGWFGLTRVSTRSWNGSYSTYVFLVGNINVSWSDRDFGSFWTCPALFGFRWWLDRFHGVLVV